METLESLKLTERDFELLVDGLEQIPSKGLAGDLMMGLLEHSILKDDESRDAAIKKRELDAKRKEAEKQLLVEEIRILQGKLLQFKRFLIERGLLEQANSFIKR